MKLFGVAAVVMAACVAAVCAHLAIDAAGDFLLPSDSYDRIAHASRFIGTACAFLLTCVCLTVLLGAGLEDARAHRGAVRALVASYVNTRSWQIIALIAPLSFWLLVGMGVLDSWVGGRGLPSIAAAVGGSLALGTACVILTSSIAGALLHLALATVHASHSVIAGALERFFLHRAARGASPCSGRTALTPASAVRHIPVLAGRAGKRAPPLAA